MNKGKKGALVLASAISVSLTAGFITVSTPANAATAACKAIGAGYLPQ